MGQNNQDQNQSQRNSQTGTQQQQPGRNVNTPPASNPQRDENRPSESQRGKFGDRGDRKENM